MSIFGNKECVWQVADELVTEILGDAEGDQVRRCSHLVWAPPHPLPLD